MAAGQTLHEYVTPLLNVHFWLQKPRRQHRIDSLRYCVESTPVWNLGVTARRTGAADISNS